MSHFKSYHRARMDTLIMVKMLNQNHQLAVEVPLNVGTILQPADILSFVDGKGLGYEGTMFMLDLPLTFSMTLVEGQEICVWGDELQHTVDLGD